MTPINVISNIGMVTISKCNIAQATQAITNLANLKKSATQPNPYLALTISFQKAFFVYNRVIYTQKHVPPVYLVRSGQWRVKEYTNSHINYIITIISEFLLSTRMQQILMEDSSTHKHTLTALPSVTVRFRNTLERSGVL